jgi:hypothetical protein
MADESTRLTGGVSSADTSMYPRFQPMPQANPLAQIDSVAAARFAESGIAARAGKFRIAAVNAVNTYARHAYHQAGFVC